jgi:hypothetical protein
MIAALLLAAAPASSVEAAQFDWPKPKIEIPRPPKINIPPPNVPRPNIPLPNIPPPNVPLPNIPPPNVPRPNIPLPNIPLPNIPPPNIPQPNFPPPNIPQPNVGVLLDEMARLDRMRLEQMNNLKYAASENAFNAYRNDVEGRNLGHLPIFLRPGDTAYTIVAPFLSPYLNISKVAIRFDAYVPADMAAITFGDRIYVREEQRPNDPNQAILLAHEMTHSVQYARLGEREFAHRYFGQAMIAAITAGRLDIVAIHDQIELEREANAVEEAVRNAVILQQQSRPSWSNHPQSQPSWPNQPQPQPSWPDQPQPSERGGGEAEQFAGNLGISYVRVPYADGTFGARITRPPGPGTPAAQAGLEQGDIVFRMDEMPFRTPDDVLNHRAVTSVAVVNVRNGQMTVLTVTIP